MPLDNLSGFMMPSMPYSTPGASAPSGTGNVAPIAPPTPAAPPSFSSPLAGPAAPMLPAVGDMDPAALQYDTETQTDGTLLLRVRMPDGSIGPVVAHLPPPKLKGSSAPSKK